MNKNFVKVARCIINAQIASDYAKGIYDLSYEGSDTICKRGYQDKDKYILAGIRLILKYGPKSCGCSFSITGGDWSAPILVYFNFKIGKKRKQVSFHSWDTKNLFPFGEWKEKRHVTRWVRHTPSRENCYELAEFIGLKNVIYV